MNASAQQQGIPLQSSNDVSIASLQERGLIISAPEEIQKPARDIVLSLLRALIHVGITNYAGIDFQTLRDEISQIRIFYAAEDMRSVEGRVGSLNLPGDRAIIIQSEATKWDDATSLLITHEFLGAAGYIDDDYNLSAPLILLFTHPEYWEVLLQHDVQELVQRRALGRRTTTPTRSFLQQFAGSGGISGVGSGGDGREAEIKSYLIMKNFSSELVHSRHLTRADQLFLFDKILYLRVAFDSDETLAPTQRFTQRSDNGNTYWIFRVPGNEWPADGSDTEKKSERALDFLSTFCTELGI